MGTVACCARIPCCKVCLSCTCWRCCLDTYLHIYVRSIELSNDAMKHADTNIAGTGDIYCEIIWGAWRQITSVSGGERGGITETEPIILENAAPDDAEANGSLIIQVWDHDRSTSDDFVAAACLRPRQPDDENMPLYYGQNIGETRLELWTNEEGKKGKGEMVGHITIDQIHFIQQKLQPYRGCKFQCCCCDDTAPVCCCIETAKSSTKRAREENRELMQQQQEMGKKVQSQEDNGDQKK